MGCVIGLPLPTGRLQEVLCSGEVLCDVINALRPGIIKRVAREEATAAMTEQRRNARMRENIGQYVDSCAEVGMAEREFFDIADLFEDKNWKVVLKNLESLARIAHDQATYGGPLLPKASKLQRLAISTLTLPKNGRGTSRAFQTAALSEAAEPQ